MYIIYLYLSLYHHMNADFRDTQNTPPLPPTLAYLTKINLKTPHHITEIYRQHLTISFPRHVLNEKTNKQKFTYIHSDFCNP